MDNLSETEQLVRQVGIEFPLLYSSGDPAVPLAYAGLMDGGMNAFPATYIIGADGQLKWEYVGQDYTDWAPTEDVIEQLTALVVDGVSIPDDPAKPPQTRTGRPAP